MRYYPLRKLALFSMIFLFSFSNSIAQNIDYQANINRFEWEETDCNSELGTNEYSFRGSIYDFVNEETHSGCYIIDEDGDGTKNGIWASIDRSGTAVSQLRLSFTAFEDDSGARCTYDSGDDCYLGNSETYDLTDPNENGAYNSYSNKTVSSGPYDVRFRYRYRYATTDLNTAVDNSNAITTGGTQPFWGSRGSWASDGYYCATSGRIDDNQTSSFSTTVSCKNSVTFKWNVDSESDFDYLRFMIDGVEQAKISGSPGWATVTYALDPTKQQTLTWEYTKDGNTSTGLDRGFVDAISFQSTSIPSVDSGSNFWYVKTYYNGYRGYYIDDNLNIDTRAFYDVQSSPSEATGYVGCYVPIDNHTIQYNRTGFPCGLYQIDITSNAEQITVYINGQSAFFYNGTNDSHDNIWTGILDANSQVVITTYNLAEDNETVVNFTDVTELSGGVVSNDQNICPSAAPDEFITETSATGAGDLTYRWYESSNQSNWSYITNADQETYHSAALSSTTYFRREATDECSNTMYSNTITITVEDLEDPETPTLGTLTGECSVTAVAPTTTDNCEGTLTATTEDPLSYTEVGNYSIDWTFDDGNGNSITVPQSVAVFDVTDPETLTLENVIAECSVTVEAPTTTDNCVGVLTATTEDPVTYSETGSYSISWVFDDSHGNSITENQTVIIYDVTAPETPTLADVNGDYSVTVEAPTTTDACEGEITGTTDDPLTYETAGQYSITWTFDDGNGNSTTADQTVNVLFDEVVWSGSSWINVDGPTMDDLVIIDGNYTFSVNGPLTAKTLQINLGSTLIVDNESTLTITNDILNEGHLEVKSGSSLITYDGNSITGNDIEFRRNTRYADGKYSFVGTPVAQDASIVGSDLGAYVYKYNEVVGYGADGINRWIDASSDELVPGRGYTQANQLEIVFVGIPNMGTIVYSGTYTEDAADANEGWNLVSNPYAAGINVTDFIAANTNTSGSVYIWDDNGSNSQRGTNADYIVANGSMASSTQMDEDVNRYNNHLASAQAFFVKLNSDANTDITFNEGMRRADQSSDDNFYRKEEFPIARINLTDNKGLFKQAVIGLAEDATNDQLNRTYDAHAFNATSDYGLFTIKAGRALTLNGMPSVWEVVQLQLNTAESGIYQISAQLEGYEYELYLKDNLTGDVTDLRHGGYSFTAKAGIDTDRFQLLSQPNEVLGLDENETFLFIKEKVLHIKQSAEEIREYQLFTMNGKRLMSTSVQQEKEVDLGSYPSGIYLVFDGIKTYKIILD